MERPPSQPSSQTSSPTDTPRFSSNSDAKVEKSLSSSGKLTSPRNSSQLREYAQRILDNFQESHSAALKVILLQEAIKKQSHGQKPRDIMKSDAGQILEASDYDSNVERSRPRPRAKDAPFSVGSPAAAPSSPRSAPTSPRVAALPSKLHVNVVGSEEVTADSSDPFIVYLIDCCIEGKRTVRIQRRYKQFAELHSKLAKFLPKSVSFPPPSSKFGGRNLSMEFRHERVTSLGSYLRLVSEHCNAQRSIPDVLLQFLSLGGQHDSQMYEIFALSMEFTRRRFLVHKYLSADDDGDALLKLCSEHARLQYVRENSLSDSATDKNSRAQLLALSKTLKAQVAPMVVRVYSDSLRKTRESRDALRRGLDQILSKVLEIRSHLKTKAIANLHPELQRIVLQPLCALVDAECNALRSLAAECLAPSNAIAPDLEMALRSALRSGDVNKLRSVSDKCRGRLSGVRSRLDAALRPTLVGAAESFQPILKANESFKTFSQIVEQHLPALLENWLLILDPALPLNVISTAAEEISRVRAETKAAEAERMIPLCENAIKTAAMSLRREILWFAFRQSKELPAATSADYLSFVTYNQMSRYAHFLYKFIKKLAMKFGDRLYWALQNKHDLRSVREKVDDAVHLAFDKALKYFKKHGTSLALSVTSSMIVAMLYQPILCELIRPSTESTVKHLLTLDRGPADVYLDLGDIVSKCAMELMETAVCDVLLMNVKSVAELMPERPQRSSLAVHANSTIEH